MDSKGRNKKAALARSHGKHEKRLQD